VAAKGFLKTTGIKKLTLFVLPRYEASNREFKNGTAIADQQEGNLCEKSV
jgi:hypothetical protein